MTSLREKHEEFVRVQQAKCQHPAHMLTREVAWSSGEAGDHDQYSTRCRVCDYVEWD